MALYTVLDDGYDVNVCRSFADVWRTVKGCGEWIDDDNTKRLTQASLRRELKAEKEARIYEDGKNDWYFKIQVH